MVDHERRRLVIPDLKEEKEALRQHIVGQDEAVESFARVLARLKSGVKNFRKSPRDVKFLAGPSGVGKTEIAYALAEALSGDNEAYEDARDKVLKIDGPEFEHGHEVSRLWGPPPGFIGNVEGAIFATKNIKDHTIQYKDNHGEEQEAVIILVDEVEKAHTDLHRGFLGLLQNGEISLANNETVDLRHSVVIFTANVGSRDVERIANDSLVRRGQESFDDVANRSMLAGQIHDATVNAFKKVFPSEFRGRIKEVLVFEHLNDEQLREIARMKIIDAARDVIFSTAAVFNITPTEEVLTWILERAEAFDEGARDVEKLVKKHIGDKLALVSADQIHGTELVVDVDPREHAPAFYVSGAMEK